MSVANGIEFYLKKQFEGFKDSEETIKFTKMVNNMFDILNRKFPAEGIRKNSQDLEVFYVFECLWCDLYICTNVLHDMYVVRRYLKLVI